MDHHERALRDIVNVLGPTICTCAQNPECGLVDEAGDALRTAQEALDTKPFEDPNTLLELWFDWWRTNPDAPVKMPDGLHVRTAIHLKYREATEEPSDA